MSETKKAEAQRIEENFYDLYMRGFGLDIGYRGAGNFEPVIPTATGIDLDTPGYDGKVLPYPDQSQDFVYSSHMLEHVQEPIPVIRDWFRVLKQGGHLIITVPHRDLYEKKQTLPSRWNGDHKRFYRAAQLLSEIEMALVPNTYRLRQCKDCDDGFNYELGPDTHSIGRYEIECVVQKIKPPTWKPA